MENSEVVIARRKDHQIEIVPIREAAAIRKET
jgi:hypothetical protein